MTNKVKVTSEVKKLGVWNKIPSDAVNSSIIEFEFAEEWNDLICVAQFTQGENTYNMLINDNQCIVPAELTEGLVEISVFGTKSDGSAYRATNVPLVTEVYKSGFVGDGQTPIPPTPDLYEQLISKFATSNNGDYLALGIGYGSTINLTEDNYVVEEHIQEQGNIVSLHAVVILGGYDNGVITPKYKPLAVGGTFSNFVGYTNDSVLSFDTEFFNEIRTTFESWGATSITASVSIEPTYYGESELTSVYGIDLTISASRINSEHWEEAVQGIATFKAIFESFTKFTYQTEAEPLEFTLAEVN